MSLLLAVPLHEDEFLRRVGESDWLSKFNDPTLGETERTASLRSRWQSEYAPFVATHLRELAAVASGFGVEVTSGATLQSLREATAKHEVVILFAHWKGPELTADDFIRSADKGEFVKRVEDDESPLALWLREQFRVAVPRRSFRFRKSRPRSLRDLLTASLHRPDRNDTAASDGVDVVLEADVTRSARWRDEIDRLFKELLRPGNRLELFSGLHSKEEVETAIAPEFHGVLDLTTCTSTVLADFIGAKRRQRVRTVQFPEVQDLSWAAQCVGLTLTMVVEEQLCYQSARSLATDIVQRAVVEYAAKS